MSGFPPAYKKQLTQIPSKGGTKLCKLDGTISFASETNFGLSPQQHQFGGDKIYYGQYFGMQLQMNVSRLRLAFGLL